MLRVGVVPGAVGAMIDPVRETPTPGSQVTKEVLSKKKEGKRKHRKKDKVEKGRKSVHD